MKNLLKNSCASYQLQIFTALVLTGILSVFSGLTLIKSTNAAPVNLLAQTTNELSKDNLRLNRLPSPVANAVLRDISQKEGLAPKKLSIINYSQKTWRNGCLELPEANELCTQALVPGWLVAVSDGEQNWIYHTNSNGRFLRLASRNNPSNNEQVKLPQAIKNAVLQDASARLQQPIGRLKIIQAQQQTWKDGCLELADANQVCTAVLVPGWRVVVGAVNQSLVYHTNQTGAVIKLNQKASEINVPKSKSLQPVPIPANQLPPPLDKNVVFRQISSGGLTGRTYQTLLLNDGQLIRVRIGDANDSERSVSRISPQQLRKFQQLLERSKFSEFNNLSYPAPNIAADYITYTVTSPEGTVQYNDISQNNLTRNLQVVVKAWNRISKSQIADNSTAVPIPVNELPPPLDQGVVFREITSGGLTGRNYETVLLKDGRLIRVRIGDANDSERSVQRISLQRVERFQKLLTQQKFADFQNLSYPAPQGSADYITYTLTSPRGTVKYNDISLDQNTLPKNLLTVVHAWEQLTNSR